MAFYIHWQIQDYVEKKFGKTTGAVGERLKDFTLNQLCIVVSAMNNFYKDGYLEEILVVSTKTNNCVRYRF